MNHKPNRRHSSNGEKPSADAAHAARSASLRYITDDQPGITRRRSGTGFRYFGPRGRPLRTPAVVGRIRALAIPPAWTDVWICPLPNGHLQATGRDERGRKQYLYHAKWNQVRDDVKFDRLALFGSLLPRIRRRVRHDLKTPGLNKEKILATVVQLLETTMIRVGNEEYARANHSFGLTTLRNHHAAVRGQQVRFRFRGKSGKARDVEINDPRVARTVRRCQELPGHELFQYLDEARKPHEVDSADVNDYLREITGQEITAKDFRTWAGTWLAATLLCATGKAATQAAAKRAVRDAIDGVAEQLGNTPAVCRKAYIHPVILSAFLDSSLQKTTLAKTFRSRKRRTKRRSEQQLVQLLKNISNGHVKNGHAAAHAK